MPQQFEQPQAQQAASQEDDALATTQAAAQTESTDQADVLDDILDDIESALETQRRGIRQQLRAKRRRVMPQLRDSGTRSLHATEPVPSAEMDGFCRISASKPNTAWRSPVPNAPWTPARWR